MIEEHAVVIAVSSDFIVVEIKPQSSCNSCGEKSSCGTRSLSELFGKRPSQFKIKLNPADTYHVGETVTVGLAENQYVKASLFIYIVPLLLMFGFAVVIDLFITSNDFVVSIAALCGLGLGFVWSSRRVQRAPQLIKPQLIKTL